MRVASVASLLLAGACHLPPAPAPSSPLPDGSLPEPLVATLHPHVQGESFAFRVNRPAYVAVFNITPGEGATLLYPRTASSHRVYAGTESVAWRWAHVSDAALRVRGGHTFGPSFLFMIASEEPLDLRRASYSGPGFRVLSVSAASLSPASAMHQLTELIVPNALDGAGWTTDYFMYWPNENRMRAMYASRRVPFRCDGARLYVPRDLMEALREYVCDQRLRREGTDTQRADTVTRKPEEPGDPGKPEKPGRRRPLSPETRLTDRIRESSQLHGWKAELARRRSALRPGMAGRTGDYDTWTRPDPAPGRTQGEVAVTPAPAAPEQRPAVEPPSNPAPQPSADPPSVPTRIDNESPS